jgi:capsular exopolysaccharide synthesis family protein
MAIILIAALMIAVGAVYALEASDKSFRSTDRLEEALHLPVLGMTLRVRRRSVLPVRERTNVSRQIIASPTSAISEAVRLVRTAITFSRSDRRPRVIMVTSAVPAEGKTTLALMLARQSALAGRRTILVEAEMRKPSLGKELSPLPAKGLADYLLDCATLNEVVGVDAASGMHFIADGEHHNAVDRSSGELLGSPRMAALLQQLSSQFDLVVLDTPPATIVADALQFGESVDAAILVVKWGSTPKHLVLDAASKLRAARVPLVGAVLTQVDARKYRSYGHGPLPHEYATGYYAPS